MKEIDILDIIKWIAIALLIIVLGWYALGKSPTFEQIFSIATAAVFMVLAVESRHNNMKTNKKLDSLLEQTNKNNQEQITILKEISNKL